MTYTFKLARRLAVSRDFAMIAVLALLVACMEDSTGPAGEPTRAPHPGFLQVFPRVVTVETNQSIRFRGESRTSRGDIVSVPLAWHVSEGGVIKSDGTFSSSAVGSFTVVGRVHRWSKADTAVVMVVPRLANVKTVTIDPDSVSLVTGATQVFSASARLNNGSKGTAGVVWTASGGLIDPDGSYRAGNTPGTYHVIAATTSGSIADTAAVTITGSTPEPEPDPDPPPQPTLAGVVLSPVQVSLVTGGSKQFKAYGRNSDGDSVSVVASFRATGGTITSAGLYTAGQTAGSYKVIAMSEDLADTAVVTLNAPTAPTGEMGTPFGPWAAWDGNTLKENTESFTASIGGYRATTILSRIDAARSKGVKLMLALTGGDHELYMTDGVFDMSKWKATMDTYNTSTIRQAVAAAVADGVILGNSVMDEPHVHGGGGDGNTWGPAGTMTKARVDTLCGYVKRIFPTLPVGVVHRHDVFEPTKSYQVCDFIISQYGAVAGSVTSFRDAGLAYAKRDGIQIAFSMNILNGGIKDLDYDGVWECPVPLTGGYGTFAPNCRMTAQQLRDFGTVLGSAGCALMMWRYDSGFMANPDNQRAFKDLAARLATVPRKSCRLT